MFRVVLLVVAVVVVGGALRSSDAVAQEPLSISGTVWEDLNANGVRDPEDPPLLGASIRLQTAPEFRGSMVRTDSIGLYQFANVRAGRHVVQVLDSRAFYWTYPARQGAGEYTITVIVSSASVSGVDFGVHRPEEHIAFVGSTWVYGVPEGGGEVRAFIGGADCTTEGILPPHTATFHLSVIASDLDPACGDPGDVIRFEVAGLPANEPAVWEDRVVPGRQLGTSPVRLTLTVGPPFGYLTLQSVTPRGTTTPEDGTVFAYMDGELCAENEGYGQGGSMIVLRSTAYPDGCGYGGASVVLMQSGVEVARTEWQEGFLGEFEVPWVPNPDLLDDPVYYESVYGYPPTVAGDAGQRILPPSVGDGGVR